MITSELKDFLAGADRIVWTSAQCTAGKVLLSGGYEVNGASELRVIANRPDSDSRWLVYAYYTASQPGWLRVWAICSNKA